MIFAKSTVRGLAVALQGDAFHKQTFPEIYTDKIKIILERSALNCPVHKSLSEKIVKNIKFIYKEG